MSIRTYLLLLMGLITLAARAGDARYEVIENGSAVRDSETKLTWKRCLEGMNWNGTTCEGEAIKISLREAEKRWKGTDGWRIPTLVELKSITKEFQVPAMDTDAFPNTPAIGVWSCTAYARTEDRAQYISYANGSEYFDYRAEPHGIRLVRN